jgi:hypothetical protein
MGLPGLRLHPMKGGRSGTQQTQYDLWHAEKRRKELRVSRVAA